MLASASCRMLCMSVFFGVMPSTMPACVTYCLMDRWPHVQAVWPALDLDPPFSPPYIISGINCHSCPCMSHLPCVVGNLC